jgi:hypothetical protein
MVCQWVQEYGKSQQNHLVKAGVMAQVIEHLPSNHEALSSNQSAPKEQARKEERKKGGRERTREGRKAFGKISLS